MGTPSNFLPIAFTIINTALYIAILAVLILLLVRLIAFQKK